MSDIDSRSYPYLRTAIVILLLGLGTAIVLQTIQEGRIRDSVSAYYYTTAGVIFVVALIGMGACMVAIRATSFFDHAMLKLAGMFAATVAAVPTARGPDFDAAIRACEERAVSPQIPLVWGGHSCPTLQALQAASAHTGTISATALGILLLIVTIAFVVRGWREDGVKVNEYKAMGLAFLVFALGFVVLLLRREWFIHNAHFIAAAGLFVCVFLLTLASALTESDKKAIMAGSPMRPESLKLLKAVIDGKPARYAWIARAMLAAVIVLVPAWLLHRITLFWVEIVVAALFLAFWLVRTTGPQTEPPQPPGTLLSDARTSSDAGAA